VDAVNRLRVVAEHLLREPFRVAATLGPLRRGVAIRVQGKSVGVQRDTAILDFRGAVAASPRPLSLEEGTKGGESPQNFRDPATKMELG
jgi:hypothetical protein